MFASFQTVTEGICPPRIQLFCNKIEPVYV